MLQSSTREFVPPPTRETLQQYLLRASALEQQLLCAYLFTTYSLKQDPSEGGFSDDAATRASELGATLAWKRAITSVAVQEMLHLALASNMLTAIGGKPKFSNIFDLDLPSPDPVLGQCLNLNFPIDPHEMTSAWGFDRGAWLGLWPFSKTTIKRYVWFESFMSGKFPGKKWQCTMEQTRTRTQTQTRTHPQPLAGLQGISTLVELYEAIAEGFLSLSQSDPNLFAADDSLQVTDQEVTGLFNFPPATIVVDGCTKNRPLLNAVTDLQSALIAINTIVVQGEGDSDEWKAFIDKMKVKYPTIEFPTFPAIATPPHHQTFQQILKGVPPTTSSRGVPGYLKLKKNNPSFKPARRVPSNPLVCNPCGADDPACDGHVHLIKNPFTRQVAQFCDDLFVVMMDILKLGFCHQSGSSVDAVQSYEKATLIQSSIRALVYILGPVANGLTQLPIDKPGGKMAGPGFIYPADHAEPTWDSLVIELKRLSEAARAIAACPETAEDIWLSPPYLGIPTLSKTNPCNPAARNAYPQSSLSDLLLNKIAPDLLFMSDRLTRVQGNQPPIDPATDKPFAQHVCHGLNACKGQDIEGTAQIAGAGSCATADPHVCTGQNHCAGQGGCGFSPGGVWMLQNHPGQNHYAGQVKDADGIYQYNPNSDSACGSPILPSLINTYGLDTPPDELGLGGSEKIYQQAGGHVWDFARILFEEKMKSQGKPFDENYSGIKKYRDLEPVDCAED